MKHALSITLFLVATFFLAQLLGLFIVSQYVNISSSAAAGKTVVYDETYENAHFTPLMVENESTSFWYILVGVFFGTLLFLLLVKFKTRRLWKLWFFLSVLFCLVLGFTPFVSLFYRTFFSFVFPNTFLTLSYYTTLLLALVLTYLKVFKRNVYVHNFTELFIYGGLAALIVPLLNLFSVTMLLLLISVYDAYAVWKSKHMVAMAQFQSEEKTFAGLFIPYIPTEGGKAVLAKRTVLSSSKKFGSQDASFAGKVALLGGGDVAFPLLFSSVVLKTTTSFFSAFVISVCAAIALFLLLYYAKKDAFYPAMPFISAGCFVGYSLVWLFVL